MGKKDPRVDAYIEKAAPFAQPILRAVRKMVHQGCPEAVETIKWSMPHFEHQGPMLGMAAFKAHCAVGFWRGELIFGKRPGEDGGMGHFGKVTRREDLPESSTFVEFVRKAAALNRAGVKPERPPRTVVRTPLKIPRDLAGAFRRNGKAAAAFEKLSYSHRSEYLEWIGEAKRDETRKRRLATTLQWLEEGKSRNWKYERR